MHGLYTNTVCSPIYGVSIAITISQNSREYLHYMSSVLDLRDLNAACYTVYAMYHFT